MELLDLIINTLSDKLGEQIVSIDMRSVNPFTDYFVITTAKNLRHADALANDLMKEVEKNGYTVRTREGSEGSEWILVDFNEVIVHIFTDSARQIYKLENLWGDLEITRY
ncbi:MAG: ribosome silencing factor [Solobacterium sp.]|nr:ribosome silencing factor [Solobacterium sp.]